MARHLDGKPYLSRPEPGRPSQPVEQKVKNVTVNKGSDVDVEKLANAVVNTGPDISLFAIEG